MSLVAMRTEFEGPSISDWRTRAGKCGYGSDAIVQCLAVITESAAARLRCEEDRQLVDMQSQ